MIQNVSSEFPHFSKSFSVHSAPDQRLLQAGVDAQEYSRMLLELNGVIESYNPCSTCNWVLMVASCGMCPWTMLYMGFTQQNNVRSSLRSRQKHSASGWSKLSALGISVEYYNGGRAR